MFFRNNEKMQKQLSRENMRLLKRLPTLRALGKWISLQGTSSLRENGVLFAIL